MNHTPRTVAFKAGERNIFFHILTACNLSCGHCYINPDQHGSQTLPLETIEKWLGLFVSPEKKSNVIFLGGEPTLHPDLPAAISMAKALGYFVTVDSNGYLFHDFLSKTSSDVLDYLSFSLDGPDSAVNDPLRGDGVFATCVKNLKQAVAQGFHVSVIYTVSSRNIDHLERMVPLLAEWGVKKFFVQVIGLRGRSAIVEAGGEALQVSREQWLAVVPGIAKMAAEEGIHVTYPKVFLGSGKNSSVLARRLRTISSFPMAGSINVLSAKTIRSMPIALKRTGW